MKKQIINSLLDTDLYTFSVCYLYLNKFPRAEGKYEFFDRNKTVYPQRFAEKIMEQVKMMENIQITEDEVKFIKRKCYYLPEWFLTSFLQGYRFNASEIHFEQDEEGHLHGYAKGLLWRTIFWEVPLLAIISELAHEETGDKANIDEVISKTKEKYVKFNMNGIVFSDFGTRRRFSFDVQDAVVRTFAQCQRETNTSHNMFGEVAKFVGTSNVLLAMKYDLTPVGTMSHQLISGIGALFGYQEANYLAMDYWQQVYQADLGTYLYDTYGWDAFEKNFTKKHANLFKALRVDSGDNIEQMSLIIDKYKSLDVDPTSKYITFSNALTTDDAIYIKKRAMGRIGVNFGIGTHFTCDIDNVRPMNIVMKLVEIRMTERTEWRKAVKLSNDHGKYTGDLDEVDLCKRTLRIK